MATREQIQALARFDAAMCFRSLSTATPRRIDNVTAKLCGDTSKAVNSIVIRECTERGWLARPAAGQLCVTETGRAVLDSARREARRSK